MNQNPLAEPATDPQRRYLCRHIHTLGHRCHSPALTGAELCYHHTRARRQLPISGRSGTFSAPTLDDRASLQLALNDLYARIAGGDIDLKRAAALLHVLREASLNLARRTHPTLADLLPAPITATFSTATSANAAAAHTAAAHASAANASATNASAAEASVAQATASQASAANASAAHASAAHASGYPKASALGLATASAKGVLTPGVCPPPTARQAPTPFNPFLPVESFTHHPHLGDLAPQAEYHEPPTPSVPTHPPCHSERSEEPPYFAVAVASPTPDPTLDPAYPFTGLFALTEEEKATAEKRRQAAAAANHPTSAPSSPLTAPNLQLENQASPHPTTLPTLHATTAPTCYHRNNKGRKGPAHSVGPCCFKVRVATPYAQTGEATP
ncbi:MAG TPA: hypothetical protein VGU46_01845 [Acidobacteriaceae bacterium]|nr:hypothetical protein [Acidobacteriaceae bacterium]